MYQNFSVSKKTTTGLMLLTAALLLVLSSCVNKGGGTCEKCIDKKPTPTGFHRKLNAINHAITLPQAMKMVNTYGRMQEQILAPDYQKKNILPLYETFNLKAIDSLICQEKAIGFRVYMAMDDKQQVRFVLVGVDGDGKDILQNTNDQSKRSNLTSGITPPGNPGSPQGGIIFIAEAGQRWP